MYLDQFSCLRPLDCGLREGLSPNEVYKSRVEAIVNIKRGQKTGHCFICMKWQGRFATPPPPWLSINIFQTTICMQVYLFFLSRGSSAATKRISRSRPFEAASIEDGGLERRALRSAAARVDCSTYVPLRYDRDVLDCVCMFWSIRKGSAAARENLPASICSVVPVPADVAVFWRRATSFNSLERDERHQRVVRL